jgi:hypothetical protein
MTPLKKCSHCKIEQLCNAFYKDLRVSSGLWAKCIDCHKLWSLDYKTRNKTAIRARRKELYPKRKEAAKVYAKAYRTANPDKTSLLYRKRRLRHYYGLSLDDYDKLFAKQNGLCAICGRPERRLRSNGDPFNLSVDHNHKTSTVRSLLCYTCNSILGYLEEDVILATSVVFYLEKWAGK